MGQALRRATGRIGSSTTSSHIEKPLQPKPKPKPPPPPPPKLGPGAESIPKPDGQVVLEEMDPQYNEMLRQTMVRMRTKPGLKPEMREAVFPKYARPLPKLRNTTPASCRYEDMPAPPGKLNVTQLRHVMQLYEGKADDHDGPMDIAQIATKFRVEASQLQKIVQYVSMPPEDSTKSKNDEGQ